MYGALSGMFAVSSNWAILYLLKREVYPTILRTTAAGAIVFVSRIGALAAPFIKQIVIYQMKNSFISFSIDKFDFKGRNNWPGIHIHALCFIVFNNLWISIYVP